MNEKLQSIKNKRLRKRRDMLIVSMVMGLSSYIYIGYFFRWDIAAALFFIQWAINIDLRYR